MRFAILLFLGAAIPCSAQGKVTGFEVNLTWKAPASSPDPVAGYIPYRSPSGANNWQAISAQTPATSATDVTVQPGAVYDYIVESVDAVNVESSPSNIATVNVPPLPATPSMPTVTINP